MTSFMQNYSEASNSILASSALFWLKPSATYPDPPTDSLPPKTEGTRIYATLKNAKLVIFILCQRNTLVLAAWSNTWGENDVSDVSII